MNYHAPKFTRDSSSFLDSVLLPDIVFIGPVGSGKSSLIGSLYRSVNEEAKFPDRVSLTLNHPDEDTHGTMQWMETAGNAHGTVIYQDTRGDQVCECVRIGMTNLKRGPGRRNGRGRGGG